MTTKKKLDIDVFSYKLPKEPAANYANSALNILRKLEQINPSFLLYFLAANTVLTLSGVRAYDTYITFEKLNAEEIKKATELLASEGLSLFPHWSEYDDADKDVYSLIHHEALGKIPEQYKIKAWIQPNPPFSLDRLLGWTYLVEGRLFDSMEQKKLPKDWYNDHWSAHNIRFGILLGYPGEAIAGGCWADIVKQQEGKELPMIKANIAYHDSYDAAHPTYFFLTETKDNPNIQQHQRLWSDILTRVYESEWHEKIKDSLLSL